ncbi:DUF1926 domain-containing protein [bacterium]|nr:DUF1926 domain-containing protein [bacterium]
MSSGTSLAFGVHCHQPIGNFPEVIHRAVDECYLPFLKAVLARPKFKCFAHFSGALLLQVESDRPELIDILSTLSKRGQMELLGGGLFEPILSVLPEPERTGQIRRMSDLIERLFGCRPRGLWLAERVWEPQLCRPLAEARISYVLLDDSHIQAGRSEETSPHGYYVTEDAGCRVAVFPINEDLRYMIPYKPVEDVLDRVRKDTSFPGSLLTYADDGEKFGLWPGTRKWIENPGLMEAFLEALETAPDVDLVTPSEWMAAHSPIGLAYPPTASYREMSEWALSGNLQEEHVKLKAEIERHPRGGTRRRLLREGHWRNFLTKYPEANWMQKRVFTAIEKIGPLLDKLGADREARAMREHLDRATCNDAYWHGLFGGLYLPHLRQSVFANLLEAENRFSRKMGLFPSVFTTDLDADGWPEILVYTKKWVAAFKPDLGGGIVEWSFRPALYNFQNTLTRRHEAYHGRISRSAAPSAGVYDRYRKMSGLLHALEAGTTFDRFKTRTLPELVPADGPYEWTIKETEAAFGIRFKRDAGPVFFEKEVVIFKDESKLSIQAAMQPRDGAAGRAVLGLGFELFYASPRDLTIRIGSQAPADLPGRWEGEWRGREVEIVDRCAGTRWVGMTDRDVRIFVESSLMVCQSETGFEKTFQGLSILLIAEPGEAGDRQGLTVMVETETLNRKDA